MEAALKRTTEVHRSQLRQKEVELQELQRLMAAKERSGEWLQPCQQLHLSMRSASQPAYISPVA